MRAARLVSVILLVGACSTDGNGSGLIDRGVCDTLIECASNIAPEARDEYLEAYGKGGTCWANGNFEFCRDTCRDSLDALNLAGQVTGQTCGICESDSDCSIFGAEATCEAGLCIGVGSGDGETGEDTGTSGCTPLVTVPDECLRFVECIGAISPEQQESVDATYGATGSCWCGTEDEANACYQDCVQQLEAANTNNPTVAQCHESWCSLEELQPGEPYGPVVDGSCPPWNGSPQEPIVEPFGIPGSFCSPACSGIAMSCPEHPQTSADGSCYLLLGDVSHCVSRCWVDPTVIGGAQCQCGATCQPQGAPDGEGNLRGICTFE